MPQARPDSAREICWTVTDGSAGMDSQCLGLAEALGFVPAVKHVRRLGLQAILPPHWLPARLFLDGARDAAPGIAPPWPDLVISCGRTAAGYALAIKRLSGGRTYAVHIQNPRIAPDHFDLVAAPEHDRLAGANVIATQGAIHRVTPEKLRAGAERFAAALARLPRPLIAVLVGGPNRFYHFSGADATRLADEIIRFAEHHDAGLAVTVSRRTSADAVTALKKRLADRTDYVFWDGTGENPYFGFLGLADAVIATCDSVSMISEACATGRPVYIVELQGPGSKRFRRFYESFIAAGMARRFDGTFEDWRYTPLDEAGRIAAEIRRRRGPEPQP